MRPVAIGLLVAACAPTPAPAIAHHGADEQSKPPPHQLLFDRQLSVGSTAPAAIRTIWQLSIDGASATLVETDQEARGATTIDRADREAKWTTKRTHTKHGPVRQVGDHLALDLESDTDSLDLRCWRRSLVVATAGARRVPSAGHRGDCDDPGTWSPATTTRIDALVCGQGDALDDGQLAGIDGQSGSLDETLWRFAAAPGVELVAENDGCFDSSGLRLAM